MTRMEAKNMQQSQGQKKPDTKFEGRDLVPDISAGSVDVIAERFYWVGVLPDCPTEGIVLAGISFPKVNEDVKSGPDGRTVRVPRIGAITILTASKVALMREKLRQTVVRFTNEPEQKDEPGTGVNIGHPHRRARRGHIITIPTASEIKASIDQGHAVNSYVPAKYDKPAADYMFCVRCENQDNPQQGFEYPPPLSQSGLEWREAS
jgi:hypothetical protein